MTIEDVGLGYLEVFGFNPCNGFDFTVMPLLFIMDIFFFFVNYNIMSHCVNSFFFSLLTCKGNTCEHTCRCTTREKKIMKTKSEENMGRGRGQREPVNFHSTPCVFKRHV